MYDNTPSDLLGGKVDALTRDIRGLAAELGANRSSTKAAAILAGAGTGQAAAARGDNYDGEPFLAQIKSARMGEPAANEYIKAVLGVSDATGQAIIPNAFVGDLVRRIGTRNIFRSLITYNTGIRSATVDVPYDVDAVAQALKQGSYGSNKDVRDFTFAQATATLYTIAQIADVGNQLLRQSNGAAEAHARRRLAESIGITESKWILNGNGSTEPLGILQALLNVGDIADNKYALNSEARVSAIGNGIAKLEARGVPCTGIVLSVTDYWELSLETLGTSGAGGWAMEPSDGPAASGTPRTLFGIPVYRTPDLAAGTGLVADWSAFDVWIGQDYRIDVSSEAGNRFDQNVTGFRAEEDFGFTALPAVATGRVVKVTGL